jgi:ferric-dicitrate binding protein FerR (iron transport regulator)
MPLVNLFDWFKRNRTLDQSDGATRSIENALEANARRLRSVSPETNGQWRRLKLTLAKDEGAAMMRQRIINKVVSRPAISLAVAMTLLIVLGVLWLSGPSTRMYETAKGQHATITLPDSTEVTLNYTSALTVSHSVLESTRQVTLKGEGFFDVRRNGKPFVVTTDIGTIRVLGTQFNVRFRDERLEVGVVHGSVEVSINRNGVDTTLILSKDQIVTCTASGFQDNPAALPSADYPGWMRGRLMFYRTDLLSACKELESQFDIAITLREPQLRNLTITGTIDGQSIETALTTLAQLTGRSYRREDSGYSIY